MSDFHQIMNAVKEFHTSFGIDHKNAPTASLDEKTINLRHRLMAEENDEYLEAAKNNDLVQVSSQPFSPGLIISCSCDKGGSA